MSFTFSSTAGTSGITTISVSATSREELTALVENYTLSNTGKTLLMPVTQEAYEPLEKYIIFQPTGMTWAASGDTGSLNIQSNDDWTIVSNGWIQLSRYEEANRGQVESQNKLSGNGNTIVGLRCSENTGETRTGGITGYCKSNSAISATTVIEQAGSYVKPYLKLSSTGCSIGSSSASTSVTVTSNTSWNVISDARWITLNTLSGTGNGTISFEVSGNVDSIPRKGVITVFNATYDIYAEFAVEQAGEKQYIVISPYSFQVPSTGSSGNVISISANCDYDITTDVNWITLSAASGSGNGSVSFTTGENTSKYGETGNIIFSNSAVSSYATVEIMSVEKYLSANTSSLSFVYDSAGTAEVIVYSNVEWDAIVDMGEGEIFKPWFSISPTSGSGNGSIRVSVPSASTTNSGSILLINKEYGLNWSIKISQVYGNNVLLYKSTNGNIVTPYNTAQSAWSATIISNTYVNGQGVIKFDNEITEIPQRAFINKTTLSDVEIPDTVTFIGMFAFYNTGLSDVVIPDTVTVVDRAVFQECSNLRHITIGKNCTQFGELGYVAYPSPINLTIRVENIPNNYMSAYNHHTPLSGSVVFDTTVKTIGSEAFSSLYITGLTFNTNQLSSIGDDAFRSNVMEGRLILPEGLRTIGEDVFGYNSGVTSLTIPSTVEEIGNFAFTQCSSLTEIYSYPKNCPRIFASYYNASPFGYIATGGTFHYPKVGTSYDGITNMLPSGWTIVDDL